jgi:hypothetical protein
MLHWKIFFAKLWLDHFHLFCKTAVKPKSLADQSHQQCWHKKFFFIHRHWLLGTVTFDRVGKFLEQLTPNNFHFKLFFAKLWLNHVHKNIDPQSIPSTWIKSWHKKYICNHGYSLLHTVSSHQEGKSLVEKNSE